MHRALEVGSADLEKGKLSRRIRVGGDAAVDQPVRKAAPSARPPRHLPTDPGATTCLGRRLPSPPAARVPLLLRHADGGRQLLRRAHGQEPGDRGKHPVSARVASTATATEHVTPRLLEAFCRRQPDADVVTLAVPGSAFADLLRDHRADVVIGPAWPSDEPHEPLFGFPTRFACCRMSCCRLHRELTLRVAVITKGVSSGWRVRWSDPERGRCSTTTESGPLGCSAARPPRAGPAGAGYG
ncbi:LysR substrate-binding domain-containing protein [Streptomyces sp. NPDC005202]|uniref:LysR substrate-binding domain-containing protein n=1 Tax=Streptomyces sp. NPDC005202 TaxID=3157021 RepID=UPI0033A658FC